MALYRVRPHLLPRESTTITPPFTSITPTSSRAAGQMCGTRRCREILSSISRDSQVHLVHMFHTGLSIPVPGKQTGCCHWSCSVADSGSDLKAVFGTFVWMHAQSPDIYFYYLFPSLFFCLLFLLLCSISFILSHTHTHSHSTHTRTLTFIWSICCSRDILVFFSNDIIL